jgi:hypothetical protein
LSANEERVLIHRLAAGELDAVEEEQARALMGQKPELAVLFEQLKELRARVPQAFPEPPPFGESRPFVELMDRLTAGAVEPSSPAAADWAIESRLTDAPLRYYRRELPSHVLGDAVRGPRAAGRRGMRGRTSNLFSVAEPSPGAHLFHLRDIQREDGLSVELEFYAGDVLAIHSEVLLVSAFAGSYQPTPGSIFGAIADRYGISFTSGPPADATRYPEGLLHFPVSCPAFDSLWVIELRDPRRPFSLENLRAALAAVSGRLPDMLASASTITLPLLGTGIQQLNPREVARELLSALPRWAQHPRLRTVRVFTLELEHVAVLNRALDDREYGVGNSALLSACLDLSRRLERQDWSEPLRTALKDLLQIASAPDPSMQSIALEGRRIVEAVLRVGLLTAEDETAERRRADLSAPHLELLLAHSRSAAAGGRVESNDAVMILYAAMRVAEMTRAGT